MTGIDQTRSVRRIAFFFAMEGEARGLIEALELDEQGHLQPGLPSKWYRGILPMMGMEETLEVAVGVAGEDPELACDRIGTDSAVMTSYLLTREFRPDLLVNAGTCGGFLKRGGRIGAVYLASKAFLFHGRVIPLPGFKEYGVGRIPALPASGLTEAIDVMQGVVSTSDSFTATPQELAFFDSEDVVAKEMEAAAIARLARDIGVAFLAIKAVTDLVDHPEEEHVAFLKNYQEVTSVLTQRLLGLINWFQAGRTVGELSK